MTTLKEPIQVEKITFEELQKLFKKRVFAIPDIQRDFVWSKKKIINLLDSIKKHYPIGSFLICKVPARKHQQIKENTNIPSFDPYNNKYCYIVIDGQQRLTVLYALLNGKTINSDRYKNGLDFKSIGFSSKDAESDFTFYNKLNEISIPDILKGVKYNVPKKKQNKIKECKSAFDKYSLPFIFITGYDEKKMKEAFVRLNKGGTSLSSVDQIFAEAYHKDIDIRRHCDAFMSHNLKNGFENIDKIHIIKALAANLGANDFVGSSLNSFAKKIANPRNKLHKEYKRNHKKIFHSIELAADFLTRRFKNAVYLPYPAMASILSIFYYHNKNKTPTNNQIKEIERWFWVTGFAKRYSGSKQRNNQINDAKEMQKLAESKKHKINLEGKEKIGEISIDRISKIKYNKRGALRNAYFCYLINKKPLYLTNGDEIQVEGASSILNKKNDHHFFPKEFLKKNGYCGDEINQVINICFLPCGENTHISDEPPWTYLKEYKNKKHFKKILKSHSIPYDSCVLTKGDVDAKYADFIEKRKQILAKDLKKHIGERYVAG